MVTQDREVETVIGGVRDSTEPAAHRVGSYLVYVTVSARVADQSPQEQCTSTCWASWTDM